jgi:hypothetical protein
MLQNIAHLYVPSFLKREFLIGGVNLKFASISNSFFELCVFDQELMNNTNRRPYLIILKLRFRGQKQDFAIPFRSNISSNTPGDQYHALPPRPSTNDFRKHGLHFAKMFPIKKQYLERFRTDGDTYYEMLHAIIERDLSTIIQEAQEYLRRYEEGIVVNYSTNIQGIFSAIHGITTISEVAATTEADEQES